MGKHARFTNWTLGTVLQAALISEPKERLRGKIQPPYNLKRLDLMSRAMDKYLCNCLNDSGIRDPGILVSYTYGALPRVKDNWLMNISLSELSVQPVAHSSNTVFLLQI